MRVRSWKEARLQVRGFDCASTPYKTSQIQQKVHLALALFLPSTQMCFHVHVEILSSDVSYRPSGNDVDSCCWRWESHLHADLLPKFDEIGSLDFFLRDVFQNHAKITTFACLKRTSVACACAARRRARGRMLYGGHVSLASAHVVSFPFGRSRRICRGPRVHLSREETPSGGETVSDTYESSQLRVLDPKHTAWT